MPDLKLFSQYLDDACEELLKSISKPKKSAAVKMPKAKVKTSQVNTNKQSKLKTKARKKKLYCLEDQLASKRKKLNHLRC